jgi:hypothetical protein
MSVTIASEASGGDAAGSASAEQDRRPERKDQPKNDAELFSFVHGTPKHCRVRLLEGDAAEDVHRDSAKRGHTQHSSNRG